MLLLLADKVMEVESETVPLVVAVVAVPFSIFTNSPGSTAVNEVPDPTILLEFASIVAVPDIANTPSL